MDYTSEYDNSDKSSIDDSDEACSIPGSFSPDNNQDGTSGDQKYERMQTFTNNYNNYTSLKEHYRNTTNSTHILTFFFLVFTSR